METIKISKVTDSSIVNITDLQYSTHYTEQSSYLSASNLSSSNLDSPTKALRKEGIRLDFVDINYKVNVKNFEKKQILFNISGFVNPGEILYIMGPSGSGKTTLLDFLNNRTNKSPRKNLYLNKKKWTENEFKKIARYCEQYPHLYEVLTVKETLEIAAHFFIPDKKERQQRVQLVIDQLGLNDQANTKIGGNLLRGVSGGQRQRVSIGEQLVTNPKILFLDEPTSGLDSTAAYQLMEKLKRVCINGQISVICSIHQPSQRVFDIADRQLILAGGQNVGGHQVYFGKTKELDQYLQEIKMKNLTTQSVSEWILDQINGDFQIENNKAQIFIDKYQDSQHKKYIDLSQSMLKKRDQMEKFKNDQEQISSCASLDGQVIQVSQNQFRDFRILFNRSFFTSIKHPIAIIARILTYCGMASMLGTYWYGSLNNPTDQDINKILKVIFFASIFFSSMTICVLPTYIEDRFIMMKERQNGQYKLWVYSLQNFFINILFTAIIAFASGTIVFYMVGFQYVTTDPSLSYFTFIFNLFLNLMVSESLMQLITYVFSDQMICIMVAALFVGLNMLLSGFMVKKKNIPFFWIPYYYLNFNNYSFQNFVTQAFKEATITQHNPIYGDVKYPGTALLEDIDQAGVDEGLNMAIMIGFVFVFRAASYCYSHLFHTGKK